MPGGLPVLVAPVLVVVMVTVLPVVGYVVWRVVADIVRVAVWPMLSGGAKPTV